ncbi:alpha/beta hydrolase [Aquimarina brevivitae]|uniref:Putative esterase n=1 Tax=Aquimarina brevivitae TaxID=323412 RepID=A0A4Q7P280_9FLAO|nr:esterase [Aquimarina brevivitae]RZS93687.1 putative esterase [Aquimarina brevivitae]
MSTIKEHLVSYQSTNSYSTLHKLSATTENVWIVFHGIGYLSRYFIRLFNHLDSDKNYIIAPQAPSKYYKGEDYRKVGSSWLTKENTAIDKQNVLAYVDAIIEHENIPEDKNLIVLGYSQGVSIASRWVTSRKTKCDSLLFVSGGFPKELGKEDVAFLENQTRIIHILGEKDPYFNIEKIDQEKDRLIQLMPTIEFRTHDGGHELNPESLQDIL